MTPTPAANQLRGPGLDRADERREDLEWLRERWGEALVLLLDGEGRALADAERRPFHAVASTLDEGDFARAAFLGVEHGVGPWFALELDAPRGERLSAGRRWVDLRRASSDWPAEDAARFAYARALVLWQQRTRYCGRCGSPNRIGRAGHVARCQNPECRLDQFPRLEPAIIVLVEHDGRCLLGRQPNWPARLFSTLAGFVEPGESLEDAVRREVREESGIEVGACHYHASQPWPFPAALMLGFFAEAVQTDIRIGDELDDVRWFGVDALLDAIEAGEVLLPSAISISRRLVVDWLQRRADPERVSRVLAAAGS